MTASLQHYLVITALGADRPGIVNTITRHVSSCGCNIEDSRLAMLGDEFTFIMLLSGSWNAINLIEINAAAERRGAGAVDRDETHHCAPTAGHAKHRLGPG